MQQDIHLSKHDRSECGSQWIHLWTVRRHLSSNWIRAFSVFPKVNQTTKRNNLSIKLPLVSKFPWGMFTWKLFRKIKCHTVVSNGIRPHDHVHVRLHKVCSSTFQNGTCLTFNNRFGRINVFYRILMDETVLFNGCIEFWWVIGIHHSNAVGRSQEMVETFWQSRQKTCFQLGRHIDTECRCLLSPS